MKLQTSSRLVKWAYLFSKRVPTRTSLCAFFWHCVLWTPLIGTAILVGAGAVVYAVGLAIWIHPNRVALVVGLVATAFVLFYGTRWANRMGYIDAVDSRMNTAFKRVAAAKPIQSTKRNMTILWRGLKAVKARVCPVIVLEDSSEPADLNVLVWH